MHFFKSDSIILRSKRIIASFLAFTMFVMPAFGAVVGAGGNPGSIVTDGNVTSITGGHVSGNNTFNHFTEFGVDAGHTVNQYFNTQNAVNMVNSQVNIQGIYNSFMNNNPGAGNVVFISPLGMIVGAGAQMNVGSLHSVVPTQAAYDRMTQNFDAYINDPTTQQAAWSAFDTDFSSILNGNDISTTAGVEIAGKITASGLVKIDANSIEFADTGLIKTSNMGGVELLANTGGIQGSDSLNIDAAGNVVLTAKSGDIGSVKAVKYASDGTLSANAQNGSVSVASSGKTAQLGNISAQNGVNITSDSGIRQTASTSISNSGSGDVVIANNSADSVNLGNISNASGAISVNNAGDAVLGGILEATRANVRVEAANISSSVQNAINAGSVDLVATGSIGSQASALGFSSTGTVNAQSASGMYLASNSDSTVFGTLSNSGTGNIEISSEGTTSFGAISNSNGAVNIKGAAENTINGTILANSVDIQGASLSNGTAGLINASDVKINVTGAVGSESNAIKLTNSSGDVKVSSATAQSGGIYLSADKNATFSDISATGVSSLATTNGNLSSTGTLKGSSVLINAAGEFNLQNSAISGAILADSLYGGNISAESGDLDINGVSSDYNEIHITAQNGSVVFSDSANSSAGADLYVNAGNNVVLGGEFVVPTLVVTAANNITGAASINGNNYVKLTATSGSIGGESALSFSGSDTNVEITADAGKDINITRAGNLTLNSATAAGDITLTNTGTGNVNIYNSVSSSNGTVDIASTGDLVVGTVSAAGDISLENTGTDKNIHINNSVSSSEGAVNITSAGGISHSGSDSAINAADDVTLSSSGDIAGDSSGDFVVNTSGKVNITSSGNVLLGTTASEPLKLGDITITGTDFNYSGSGVEIAGDISANNVNFTNISSFTQNSGTTVSATSGNIVVETSGDAILNGLLQATAGNVKVDASNISSTSQNAISAATIELIADNSIGSDASALNFTATGSVSAQSGTGMNLNSASDATFGSVANTTSGNIKISSSGDVSLADVSNANGNVNVNSTGSATLTDKISGQDVTFNTGDIIAANNNAIVSGNNVNLVSSGSVGSSGAAVGVESSNGINASANQGSVYLSGASSTKYNNVSAKDTVYLNVNSGTLETTGTISGNTVAISSADDAQIGGTLTSTGNISVTTTSGAVTTTGNISGGSVSLTSANGAQIGGTVTSTGAANITTNAGNVVTTGTLSGDSVAIISAADAQIGGTVTSAGNTSITAGNALSISTNAANPTISAGSITLSGANVTQTGTGTAAASTGKATITATSGNIGNSADGTFNIDAASMELSATDAVKVNSLAQNSVIDSITAETADITANNLTIKGSNMGLANIKSTSLTLGADLTTENGLSVTTETLNSGNYAIANTAANEININVSKSANLNNVTNSGRNINLNGDGAYILSGTVAGSAVVVDAGSIASAANGKIDAASVSLTSKGAIGSDSDALNLTNSSGDVDVTTATAQNGNIYLSADKNATFNNISSTGTANLATTSGTLTTTGTLSGTEVILTGADSVNAQNSSISGLLSAVGANGVTISADNGDLNVKNLSSGAGNVNISTDLGKITFNEASKVSGGTIIADAASDLVLAGSFEGNSVQFEGANVDGSAAVTADSLAITAVSGNIGTNSAFSLTGDVGSVGATASNNVNITKSGDFNINNVTATGGNAVIASTDAGNVNISGTVSAESGKVEITSAGDITKTGNDRAVNANGDITLNSAGAIANADSSLKFNVNSSNGKVNIASGGDVSLGTLDGDSAKLGEINLTSSDFNYSSDNIVVEDNITANNVNFTDFASFEQKSGTTVTANGQTGNISLVGTGNVILDGLLQATNGEVSIYAGNITSASQNAISANTIAIVSSGSVSAGGALNFTAADSAAVKAANGMNLNSLAENSTFGALENTTSGDINVTTAGNATFDTISNANGNINLGKSGAAGNYVLGGLVDGKDVTITTAGSVTSALNKAIESEKLTISAGSIGSADSALNLASTGEVNLAGTNGINVNSVDSSINVTNAASSNGAVTITASGNASDMTIASVSAKENITLTNNTNGMVEVGNMTVNSGKIASITASAGGKSGVVVTNGATITNNGTLNIDNDGDLGVNFAGELNNSGNATIDSSSGVALVGGVSNAANSSVTVNNTGGNLDLSSASVANSGTISLNNSGDGTLNLKGTVTNNKGALFEAINDGAGGLNLANTAKIDNSGTLKLTNNAGSFTMDGSVTMAAGSENTFEDGTANDFVISTDLTNNGAVVSFLQTGDGSLKVASGTNITNNAGTINLTNSKGGSFELENGAVLKNNSNSTLNITNSASAGNVTINGQITADNGAANNKVNITNSGVDIVVDANTNISNISDLKITNTADSTGSLNINGNLTNNHNVTLENLNNGATGIEIGTNPLSTTGLLTMTNYGQTGLVVNGDQISSTGGMHLTSNNSITVNGTLTNKETTTNNGLQIVNIANDGTVNNSGIEINGNIITSARPDANGNVNKIINQNTDASSAINIAQTAQITSNGGIDITSDGGAGVILDGTVLNTTVDGANYGGNINIAANNASIDLKHYDLDANAQDYANTPVRVKNEQGDISVTAQSITNSTQKEGVSLIATGNISLNATNGGVGTMDNAVYDSKTDGFTNIDDSISVNVLAGGKTSANATGDVNLRGYKMDGNYLTTKNMEYGSVSGGNTVFLPAVDGYVKADNVAANTAYIYSGQTKADGGYIDVGRVEMLGDNGLFSLEADGNVKVGSSASNKQIDFDYVISKSGAVDIALNGDSSIATITAPESVKIHSSGDNLGIEYLGKFVDDGGNVISRGDGIIPSVLDLQVTGHESGANNGTLGIMHAYVKDDVIMRADNIYAYEDAAEGSTGFHSANENGELITFDIQGVNTPQYDKFSPITQFGNPNYHPEPGDASVRDLKLTIGDVENPDAEFGAQFDRVYTENAHINATSKVDADTGLPVAAEMNFENITVNQKGRLQNNKYTIDINNVDKNYDYSADATLYTKITGSFQTYMSDNVTIDTTAPIIVYNPHRIFNLPQTENSFQRLTNKSNRIEEETTLYRFRDGRKNTRTAKDRKDIRWSISDKEHKVLGSSTSESGAVITDIIDISKGGMLVATNCPLKQGELLNVNFMYKGIPFDVQGEVVRVEENNRAGVKFVDMDRFTSNIILYIAMMTENL